MKKRYWIGIACGLTAILATVILIVCFSNPYNTSEREGWDVYATLNCFVKTEYNKDGNPVKRELYDTETFATVLVQHYRYNRSGVLSDFRVDGKALDDSYYKGARFSLTYYKESNTHSLKPVCDTQDYDAVSIEWTKDGKLKSEYAKWIVGTNFVYDEKGKITEESGSEKGAMTHRYSDDNKTILVTKADSFSEVMTVTLGDNGMPTALTSADYAKTYTYADGRCQTIEIAMLGQTVGEVLISYDKKGNPVRREVNAHVDGKVTEAALLEYEYDDNGNMTRERISQADSSLELKEVLNNEYRYDKKGNMIEETVGEYTTPGNLLALHKRLYKYDEDGNKIQRSYTKTGPGGTIVKDRSETRYYADGTRRGRTEYEFYVNFSTKKIVDTEYNKDQGIIKRSTEEYHQGEKVDGVLVDGKLKSQSVIEKNKSDAMFKGTFYEYDKNGILYSEAKYTYFNKDSLEEVYIPIQDTFYLSLSTKSYVETVYYDNGQVREKTTKEFEKNGNVKKSDTVHYDQLGNITHRD